MTDEEWARTWNLNVMAAVRATRAALPVMLAAGGGAIVNIGSVNARLADPLVIDYSAAKAALVNLAKSLSKEFGAARHPGEHRRPGPGGHRPVARPTAAWRRPSARRRGVDRGAVAAGAAAAMVTGRFTRPEEVADLVLLLASPRTANVTGADFTIDGGMITTV